MDQGKKKYLEQNPDSRRLLFMTMIAAIESCTEAIAMLTQSHRRKRGFLILPYNKGLADAALINPLHEMVAGGLESPAKQFAETLVTYRLGLYSERNVWLETWPDLVDLAGLPPLAQYPVRPGEIASNEPTGP